MPPEAALIGVLLLKNFWQFILSWYWLILVIIVWPRFLQFWFWWRYQNFWLAKQTPKWMEIKLPKDIVKPISAMEMVLDSMWKGYNEVPYFWEKWWKGQQYPFDFQFELVSDGGQIHFYVRTFLGYKAHVFKLAIWSQYPEAEITEVDDYSRAIPADLPNKDWDIRGVDFTLKKPDAWPIRTYPEFEKEAELMTDEKKRVDPMAMLLEGMADLKPGEKMWLQIKPFPIGGKYAQPYIDQGHKIVEKIAQREKPKPKSNAEYLVSETGSVVGGKQKPKEETGKIELVAPELRMTPREREIVAAIERKISKELFLIANFRFFYIARKDRYYHHRWRMMLDFMSNFESEDMNGFKVVVHTYTKIVNPPPFNLFDKRRLYVRKRRTLRLYQNRYETLYPHSGDYKWGWFVLNTEELATIFHFPSRAVAPAPGVARIEAKKAEAPPEIPME